MEVYHFLQQPFTSALQSSPTSLINERDIVQEAEAVEEVLTGRIKTERGSGQNGRRTRVKVVKFALSTVPSE